MVFKLNISENGKAWKLEVESEFLIGKNINDKIKGEEIKPELEGYELEITGGSDVAGFPMMKEVEGIGLKRVLLKKGWGMNVSKPKGLRLRKTVRGRAISSFIIQINLRVLKKGKMSLSEIFSEQNKAPEVVKEASKSEENLVKQKATPAA